jgi:hypothetical protein
MLACNMQQEHIPVPPAALSLHVLDGTMQQFQQ